MAKGKYERTDEWKQKKAEQVKAYYAAHPEALEALSQKAKDLSAARKHPCLGKVTSAETKAKISVARKAFYQTPEGIAAKQRISERRKAAKGTQQHSADTIEKMRQAALQRSQDSVYLMHRDAGLAKSRQDPNYGKRVSDGLKAFNQTAAGQALRAKKSMDQSVMKQEYYDSSEGQQMKKHLSQKTKEYFQTHDHPNTGVHMDNSAAVAGANKSREEFGHPWTGLHHTDQTKETLSRKHLEWYATPEGLEHKRKLAQLRKEGIADGTFRPRLSSKAGIREDLGFYVRSGFEANYARILKYTGVLSEYEKHTFTLKDGRTYTPDFYLPETQEYVEIKGYYTEANKEKFAQFKRDFPEVKIQLLLEDSWEWKKLRGKYKPLIPAWEGTR